MLALACTKPREHGQAAELWTRSALVRHIRRTAQAAGHPSLGTIVKSTVHAILRDAAVRPHKIKDYLERRDPQFERKMKEVLIVYREVADLLDQPAAAPVFVVRAIPAPKARQEATPSLETSVLPLGDMLDRYSPEQVIDAIRAGWSIDTTLDQKLLGVKYHADTRLLFISGPNKAIGLAEHTYQTLRQQRPPAVERAR